MDLLQPLFSARFFEELTARGPVTCWITGQRYETLLENNIVSDLQAHLCLSCTIFMQDGAFQRISCCVKDVLKTHFTEKRVISCHFPYPWPLRSPDLIPCDFWLWRHLKHLVSRENPRTLPVFKDPISQHVRNISPNTLRSVVE